MRIANLRNRLVLITLGRGALDVEKASGGRFSPDIQQAYANWDELRTWANGATDEGEAYDESDLGSPVPRPAQIFAIGLNYAAHAEESKLDVPSTPPVFTKFASSITGPFDDIVHPGGDVDWETELVVVIGRQGHHIAEEDAWDHVAGLTIGQDISERRTQLAGSPAQFSLGKSYPGFAPMGPVVVTPDEVSDRDDLGLGCSIDGEKMQDGRTSDMVFSVSQLVSKLSAITPLSPGDIVFTGTPDGVGLGRSPQRFLAVGEELYTYIESIGEMRHRIVAAS